MEALSSNSIQTPITTSPTDFTATNYNQVVSRPYGQFPPKNKNCKPFPLIRDTWHKLELEKHLKEYPGGNNLSIINYAAKLNMTNFACGIGGSCNAGQPCYPLETKEWYILFVIQQWNTYMNIYYESVGYGIAIVQSSMNALIAELFPATDSQGVRNMKANLGIQASLTQVTGTVVMDLMLALGSTTGPVFLLFNLLNYAIAAAMGSAAFAIKEPPGPLKDGFDQWSNVAYYLSMYEQAIHKKISEESKRILNTGISTKNGLYGLVKDGSFIEPTSVVPLPEVEEKIRNIALALGVNMLFRQMNAFITVGPGCRDKGVNGASTEDKHLSWCDKPGGTMHNIVLSANDRTVNEIDNANVIYESFGISTESIITSSMNCQAKNGPNHVPWAKDPGTLPKSAKDDCVFNLPVCFVTQEAIKHKIENHRWTTARACRHTGRLPLQKHT
ncbi:hypothetical protein O181_068563 [Austropuccinia psidii MF-1]|uniref:DUF7872 domain-containing protein n=1 Tax=Austropuccinia psidii MF-1 TaxID=1389203 RepID=A0A9Q3I5J3_9BASI|nr:hypothetical protein [Austropuccinia psidii MF-1]